MKDLEAVAVPGGSPFPSLTVGRYRLTFAARSAGALPEWTGSAWRGAFGRALKQSVCITGMTDCQPCPLFDRCTHAQIFETPPTPGQGKMRKYTTAPRPYVLLPDPGGEQVQGNRTRLEVRLFGRANQHHELVLGALERAAWKGLGHQRLSLEPLQRETFDLQAGIASPDRLPPQTDSVHLQLLTPLRIRVGGRYVGPGALTFGDFFSILLRRLSMLCTFHELQPFEVDFKALVAQARAIQWSAHELKRVGLKRYSSRQNSSIDMSGLQGDLWLDREDAAPFWPWLWLGQHTLTGRGCVMGLGHYRIVE